MTSFFKLMMAHKPNDYFLVKGWILLTNCNDHNFHPVQLLSLFWTKKNQFSVNSILDKYGRRSINHPVTVITMSKKQRPENMTWNLMKEILKSVRKLYVMILCKRALPLGQFMQDMPMGLLRTKIYNREILASICKPLQKITSSCLIHTEVWLQATFAKISS